MQRLRSSKVEVVIYPFDQDAVDVSRYLVQCTVSRSLKANGGFQISLVPERDWANLIKTGSWVRIDMQTGPDMRMRRATWGRVDRVSRAIQATGQGQRSRLHVLSGRDLSGVFHDYNVYFSFYLSHKAESQGLYSPATPLVDEDFLDGLGVAFNEALDGNPAAYLQLLYDAFFKRGICAFQVFELPHSLQAELQNQGRSPISRGREFVLGRGDAVKAADIIDFVIGPIAPSMGRPGLKGLLFDDTIQANQPGGTLWSLFQRYQNPDLNELFFAVNQRTGYFDLKFRERPFPCYARPVKNLIERGRALVETVVSRSEGAESYEEILADVGVESSFEAEGKAKSPSIVLSVITNRSNTLIDGNAWSNLPGTIIPRRHFSVFNVSRNLGELINYWMLFAEGTPLMHQDQVHLFSESFQRGAPILDVDSIRQHGLRRFEATSYYIGYQNVGTGSRWVIPAAFWLTQLHSWYALNHQYLSGSARVPYLERGEIGQRLWVAEQAGVFTEFYVEGITWSWVKGPKGETKTATDFMLTRGVGGIRGSGVQREHDDMVTWDIANRYPLQMPPVDDVEALLDAAASTGETWTDPAELKSDIPNRDYENAVTMHLTPEEYQGYFTEQLIQGAPEQTLEPSTLLFDPEPPAVDNPDDYAFLVDDMAFGSAATLVSRMMVGDFNQNISTPSPAQPGETKEERARALLVYLAAQGAHTEFTPFRNNYGEITLSGGGRVTDYFLELYDDDTGDSGLPSRDLWPNAVIAHRLVNYILTSYPPFSDIRPAGRQYDTGRSQTSKHVTFHAVEMSISRLSQEQRGQLARYFIELSESSLFRQLKLGLGIYLENITETDIRSGNFEAARFKTFMHLDAGGSSNRPFLWVWDEHDVQLEDIVETGKDAFIAYVKENFELVAPIAADEAVLELPPLQAYQQFLDRNGITVANAQLLTYLRDPDIVAELADRGVPGYRYVNETDRTLFAVPPVAYWYNILPSLLLLEFLFGISNDLPAAIVDLDPDPEGVLGTVLFGIFSAADAEESDETLNADEFVIFDAYRPPEYNTFIGHPQSLHRYNHAVKIRLREVLGNAYSPQISANGWLFQDRIRHVVLSEGYGFYVRFFVTPSGHDNLYYTHIDGGLFGTTLPDGNVRETTETRPRNDNGDIFIEAG